MSNIDPNAYPRYGSVPYRDQALYDEGLRAYMLGVYNYMAMALVITGAAALVFNSLAVTTDPTALRLPNGVRLTDFGVAIYASWLKWVIMLAPLGVVFFFAARIDRLSLPTAQGVFWLFATLIGLSISSIFVRYTGQSITQTFFIAAATFGATSLWAYTTKRDLSKMGSFLMMGAIGIFIASIVNLFMQSSALQFAISIIGVLVFVGFTAYDTQQIKESYDVNDDGTMSGRKSIMGALHLYLDFLNIFMFLLQLIGVARSED